MPSLCTFEDLEKTPFETGIKEKCIFNAIKGYHNIENCSVDLMHDVYEGVCNYTMADIRCG